MLRFTLAIVRHTAVVEMRDRLLRGCGARQSYCRSSHTSEANVDLNQRHLSSYSLRVSSVAAGGVEKQSTSSFNHVLCFSCFCAEPSADELRRLMMLHGGQFHVYYSRSKTTHIIATNLPNSKIQELKGEKVIRPEWITDRCDEWDFSVTVILEY